MAQIPRRPRPDRHRVLPLDLAEPDGPAEATEATVAGPLTPVRTLEGVCGWRTKPAATTDDARIA